MPNIGALLKEEIRRLARKEARSVMAKLRKDGAKLKRTAAEHKRRLAALERDDKRLVAEADARLKDAVKASPEEVASARVGASRVRALRKRLRLTQAEFGKLLGVSTAAVFQWESKQGRLKLQERTKAAIVAARKLNARDAKRKLELMAPKVVAKKRKARRKQKERAGGQLRNSAKLRRVQGQNAIQPITCALRPGAPQKRQGPGDCDRGGQSILQIQGTGG